MPNRLALESLDPVLVDAETTGVQFRYLGETLGPWQTGGTSPRRRRCRARWRSRW